MRKIYPIRDKIKVLPYIHTQGLRKVALVFLHGLGDVLMFKSAYLHLKRLCPDVHFTLYVHQGMEQLIGEDTKPWLGESSLNLFTTAFFIDFPLSDGSSFTKVNFCATYELGLPDINYDVLPFKLKTNKQVALHLAGTCAPSETNPSDYTAYLIHDILKKEGYLPIDVHFEHFYHNPSNIKPSWLHTSARGHSPTIEKMYSLISNSHFFVGVLSGPLIMALSIKPERVICLENVFKIKDYTKTDVRKCDISNFDESLFKQYVQELSYDRT